MLNWRNALDEVLEDELIAMTACRASQESTVHSLPFLAAPQTCASHLLHCGAPEDAAVIHTADTVSSFLCLLESSITCSALRSVAEFFPHTDYLINTPGRL